MDPVGTTSGWVHGGPYNASGTHSRYRLKVAGASRAQFQDQICTSGANSGEHCYLEVKDTAIRTWDCGGAICSGFRAADIDDAAPWRVAAVSGDSGGPVYIQRDDGRVGARGIMQGVSGTGSCTSPTFESYDACGASVYFVDILRLEDTWGVTVQTTP